MNELNQIFKPIFNKQNQNKNEEVMDISLKEDLEVA